MEWKHPSIIAMKGPPFTGKTSIALDLATHLRFCLLLSLDDILDSITGATCPTPAEAEQLNQRAFDILCGLAEKQLSLGVSVIIDCLPHGQLDRLLGLSRSSNATKFIIVECQIKRDIEAWKMRFEAMEPPERPHLWYKPYNWQDVTERVTSSSRNDMEQYVIDGLSRLLLNVDETVPGILINQAIQNLIFFADDSHMDFLEWKAENMAIMHQNEPILEESIQFPTQQNCMDSVDKFEDLISRESTNEMLKKIQHVGFMNMVIVMKGDAGTGKTTCANAIAKAYNCSIVSFDLTLDSLSPSTPSSPQEHDELIELAFKVNLQVLRIQLGAGRPVVFDSPLSKKSHLDQLLAVVADFQYCSNSACKNLHCRSVIVECKPESQYTWKQRFENRGSQSLDTNKWYKPKEWRHVVQTESVEDYPPEWLPGHVCRLIDDTTGCVPCRYHHLGAATLDIVSCPKGHLLNFRDWLPHKPYHRGFNPIYAIEKRSGRAPPPRSWEHPEFEPPISDINCGDDGRHLLEEVTGVEEGSLACCKACHCPISYPAEQAYGCNRCKLALHKKCAELEDKAMIPNPHSKLPAFLRIVSSAEEFYSSIPEEYVERFKCSSCTEFSVDCEVCLWEMHLGARDVPTMVRHEGHHDGSHPIGFWIMSRQNVYRHGYLCEACKLPGYCVGYTCLHGTFKFNYHVECALLPRPMSHVHGGYNHGMELVFGTREIKEDYMCSVCLERILDPKAWYFYCVKCDFTSHLHCIYEKE